ncbi:hypothetical protein AD006_31535 (plasmid) [Pseudonocardia sp. EC080610-09]|uniref:hypothetical protein n=1 Tax=unclassified Pseudonocardia TaxID=2619320 RepID=UPI000705ED22|nr:MULTISPECIES: hypothetical protein [unclassified Pseudonocardia]ALL79691.1 hypothetical protein AD006_31535 [Pseudonocardia sp. EC080610-09]ALL85355.1 hypothetical protein AD017_29715 [Pseudonocardia sp. EC080619-01]
MARQLATNKAVPLFVHPDEEPPVGALDLQVSVAPTLSLLFDRFVERGETDDLDLLRRAVSSAVERTVTQTQLLGGYAARDGRAWPCHLEITPIIHSVLPGQTGSWLHAHLMVGATARVAGESARCELDRGSLQDVLDDLYSTFRSSIEYRTTDAFRHLELHWGPPRASAPFEILIPPLHQELATTEHFRAPCTELWEQQHEIWLLPTPEHRAETLRREQRAAQRPWAGPTPPDERIYPFG